MTSFVHESLKEALGTLEKFMGNPDNIDMVSRAVNLILDCYKQEGTVYSCGNGGSMCDASHFAEELTGYFRKDRAPLRAICINDPSHISCVGNDAGYDQIFSRFLEAFGKKEDVLLAISTSGNSKNVVKAVEVAKAKGIKTVGLLGKDGGQLKNMVDLPLIVESKTSDRAQEVHIKIIHILIEGIERNLFPENY